MSINGINKTSTDGQLAQLVRASGLHPECREFDPLTAHLKRLGFLPSLFLFNDVFCLKQPDPMI